MRTFISEMDVPAATIAAITRIPTTVDPTRVKLVAEWHWSKPLGDLGGMLDADALRSDFLDGFRLGRAFYQIALESPITLPKSDKKGIFLEAQPARGKTQNEARVMIDGSNALTTLHGRPAEFTIGACEKRFGPILPPPNAKIEGALFDYRYFDGRGGRMSIFDVQHSEYDHVLAALFELELKRTN